MVSSRSMVRIARSLLALLCIAGHVGAVAHYAIVRHEVCPEHGELVDAHGGPDDHRPATDAHGSSSDVPLIAASADGDAHGDHDHCALACERRDHALIGANVVVALAPPADVGPPLSVTLLSHRSISILQLAPKASPPA